MNTLRRLSAERQDFDGRPTLTIGLVNNTSASAMASTVGRFRSLLCAANPLADVTLRLFRPPELARDEAGQLPATDAHADLAELFGARVDGLIVTGMEPQAAVLEAEPIWVSLTGIADWAEDHGVPTIWSCLAAHAAARYLDGITRCPLPEKLSGVFGSEVVGSAHPVMSGISPLWCVPHSRYYDLPEQHIAAEGYEVLSRSSEAGVDIFYKRRRAPFLFFQGHPEYHPDTLAARGTGGTCGDICKASRTTIPSHRGTILTRERPRRYPRCARMYCGAAVIRKVPTGSAVS